MEGDLESRREASQDADVITQAEVVEDGGKDDRWEIALAGSILLIWTFFSLFPVFLHCTVCPGGTAPPVLYLDSLLAWELQGAGIGSSLVSLTCV